MNATYNRRVANRQCSDCAASLPPDAGTRCPDCAHWASEQQRLRKPPRGIYRCSSCGELGHTIKRCA